MTIGLVFSIGLRVALAVGAGVLIYFGVKEAHDARRQAENLPPQPQNSGNVNNQNGGNCFPQADPVNNKNGNRSATSNIIEDLKVTQNVCAKVFTVIQSLTGVAEGINALVNNDRMQNRQFYYNPAPWYQLNNNTCNDPYYTGNVEYRRVNNYIIEAGPANGFDGYNY